MLPQIGHKACDDFLAAKKNEMLDFTSQNLYTLRTRILQASQQDMCDMMGLTARSGYSAWENKTAMPGISQVELLKHVLSLSPKTRDYCSFTLDEFYSTVIDFEHMAAPVGTDKHPFLHGTYLAYFHDFSEVRINQLELSRLKMRYMVIDLYDSIAENGQNELSVFAVPFKNEPDALALKDALDALTNGDEHVSHASALKAFLAERAEGFNENDLYFGSVSFLQDERFQISFSNRTKRDAVSILCLLPPSIKESYVGGLGAMISVSRGINRYPTAQKVILSKKRLYISESNIGQKLRVRSQELPIGGQIREIVKTYTELGDLPLTEEDKINFLEYRFRGLINQYNDQLNLCGFDISKEEDNDVFHLLKHFTLPDGR